MRGLFTTLAIIGAITGCSVNDADEAEATVTCSMSERLGNYSTRFELRTGNCAPQDPVFLRLDPDAPLSEGCVLSDEDEISADECTLTRRVVCPLDLPEPGTTVETVSATTQLETSGQLLTGTLRITVKLADGTTACSGTYGIRAERR